MWVFFYLRSPHSLQASVTWNVPQRWRLSGFAAYWCPQILNMSVRSCSLFGCWCVCVEIQAQVRQSFGMTPSSHQESSPCQILQNPGLEMKQRRVCVGVYVCICVCVCVHCASLTCLRPKLTFPTGAGVNKAANHSRCGEQGWEQGRSAPLQPQAAVKPSWTSQYLHSVSKPTLFFYQKIRLYRSRPVWEPRRCQG